MKCKGRREDNISPADYAICTEKDYKGGDGVPTENGMRAMKLVEDLTASEFAGWYQAVAGTGGGSQLYHEHIVVENYDLERSKRKALSAAAIKK